MAVPSLLLAAEAGLALFDVGEPTDRASSSIDRLHRYSEVYGWEPRPGQYVEGGRTITINDAGYRGPRLEAQSPERRRRVLVIGDSIAFGLYVGDQETYAALLAMRAGDLEVANLAVQGYGPNQSLLRLERVGLPLDPDVVVLGLCLGNDLADVVLDSFLYDAEHPTPRFRVEGERLVLDDEHLRLSLRERAGLWLHENSRLARMLAPQRSGETASEPWTNRRRAALSDREAALDLTTRLVVEMRDAVEARGARFLVLLHPERVTSARSARAWEAGLTARLNEAGVSSLSLAAAYAERGLEYDELAIDSIGHLSARGHAVTAAILAEALHSQAPPGRRRAALSDTASLPLR